MLDHIISMLASFIVAVISGAGYVGVVILMAIESAQFDDFAIQLEAMIGELRFAKTDNS